MRFYLRDCLPIEQKSPALSSLKVQKVGVLLTTVPSRSHFKMSPSFTSRALMLLS